MLIHAQQKLISVSLKPPAQATGSVWRGPTLPIHACWIAAIRFLTVSAASVRARYRASDSVSASKV